MGDVCGAKRLNRAFKPVPIIFEIASNNFNKFKYIILFLGKSGKEILKDAVSTELALTDYHIAIEGLGGIGFVIKEENEITNVLKKAVIAAKKGNAVAVNVLIGKTDFRKGSISI